MTDEPLAEEQNPMRGWFGQSWGAPICSPEMHRPTPAGEACAYCSEAIARDDQGIITPLVGGFADEPSKLGAETDEESERLVWVKKIAYHLDCWLASIVGHQGPRGPRGECPRCRQRGCRP